MDLNWISEVLKFKMADRFTKRWCDKNLKPKLKFSDLKNLKKLAVNFTQTEKDLWFLSAILN